LGILGTSDIEHLLYDLNDTQMDYANDKCIHELFEQQVADHPDVIALVVNDTQLSYKQLNEKANQLACYLKEQHDIKPDSLVGLCVERSLEMVIGILAILKAGGAYVPLDPAYPQERLSYMLDDAALDVVLIQARTRAQAQAVLPSFNGTVVTINGLGETASNHAFARYPKSNLATDNGLTSANLAYVIYTSGSTGKPKGVLIAHQSVVNLVQSQQRTYHIKDASNEVGLALASFAFDASVEQIFVMLHSANTLVVPSSEQLLAPEKLLKLIGEQQVTHIDSTPSHLISMVECLNYQSVKRVISGGEAMLPQLVASINPDTPLYNVYGPTEACVTSCVSTSVRAIGKPVANTTFLLLNESLQLVPKGTAAQLFIGGDGLARGYLNRADLTAECFIDNPFFDEGNPNSSPRLYKTGDLVRYDTSPDLPDGSLAFIGRVDDQVKIRGFRIELGEIESQLTGLDVVDSALVLAPDVAGSQQLVGYIIPSTEASEHAEDDIITTVIEALKDQLPAYMVPSFIMV
ncbi:MAG: amino acid adenylation domain-containing protein, partial [Psychrosphaera sp.]|nr:amino acid adenylation domain-containing protein [Psychrosphaera sp.]